MTLPYRLTAFFSALILVSFLGCAATPTKEGTGEYIDDAVITAKVKSAIFHEPSLKSYEINVETFKGIVQLSGFVAAQEAIDKSVEITRGVSGVKDVKNSLELK